MKSLEFKKSTQKGYIIQAMLAQPERWFLCSAFCGGDPNLPFIGYKAPTRIAEMQKKGYLVSRWSTKTTVTGTPLKEYSIAPGVKIIINDDKIGLSNPISPVQTHLL